MRLSEVSVKRPVFATVISLLLVIIGLLAATRLPIRELPNVESPVVSIETIYRGASADVVETKITQIIEDRVSGLEGVTKITSQSVDGRSSINIEFAPDRPVDELNLGKYLFEVRDQATNRLLYSRGYATIFGEWETTAEAKEANRTFHESLRFPAPGGPVQVVVKKRDRRNAFREIWSIVVDPKDMFVDPSPPAPASSKSPA